MNPNVDAFLGKVRKWRDEMEKLRTIIPDCGLTEELEWGKPCYAFHPKPGNRGLKGISCESITGRA